MSEKKDLVVKMTINSSDFENGLKKAKSQMSDIKSNATNLGSSLKRQFLSISTSTIAAGAAIATFVGKAKKKFDELKDKVGLSNFRDSFIHSTQAMGDAWDNTFAAAKTTIQTLQREVQIMGDVSVARIRNIYSEAKKLAVAMDQYQSSLISQDYADIRFTPIISEAMVEYREAKKRGDKEAMGVAYTRANDALENYKRETEKTINDAMSAVIQNSKILGISDINKDNFWDKFDMLYLRIVRGQFSEQAAFFKKYAEMSNEEFKNSWVWKAKYPDGNAPSGMFPYYPIEKGRMALRMKYAAEPGHTIQEAERAENEYVLSQVNDEALKENLKLLSQYKDMNLKLDSWEKKLIQMLNEDEYDGGFKPLGGDKPESNGLTWEQELEMIRRQIQNVPIIKVTDIIPLEDLIEEEDIIESETDALVDSINKRRHALEKMADEATAATYTMNAFSSICNSISSISGSDMFSSIASGLGTIATTASSTIAAMMALAGAETVEGIAEVFSKTPGLTFTKVAMAATAFAGVMSVIASAKSAFAGSFAEGGIVGGNSYSGDKLWARVNSGEMILNRNQQAALANGGQVKFVIEGSQLKGVLDNYESIQNM